MQINNIYTILKYTISLYFKNKKKIHFKANLARN